MYSRASFLVMFNFQNVYTTVAVVIALMESIIWLLCISVNKIYSCLFCIKKLNYSHSFEMTIFYTTIVSCCYLETSAKRLLKCLAQTASF